jgi:hypothetical protein
VIRPFRLAGLCLAISGGLFVTKVVSAPAPGLTAATAKPATTAADPLRGTLTKADKFTVVYLFQSAEHEPPLPTAAPATQQEPIKATPTKNVASADRPVSSAKVAVLLPKPRPMVRLATSGHDIDRAKAATTIKTCRRQDAIANFLVSAGIAPRCET